MATLYEDKDGWRIQFPAIDGSDERSSIRLGKIRKRTAENVKLRVNRLIEAKETGTTIDSDTARWLAEIGDKLAEKFARVGLVPERQQKASVTLGPFLADYMEKRIDVKPATKVIWGHVERNLKIHFGEDRELPSITEGDAEDFKLFLIKEKLAPTTVHKRLQVARMFFAAARKRKLIAENPFAEVTAKAVISDERQRFVTTEETERLLAVCDPTWRIIIALARYGGLRCPSEVLSLRWNNVDWQEGKIIVESPKTEHHPGKARRVIPIFAELRPHLEEAHQLASDDSEYVVGGEYLKAAQSPTGWRNCNLRTQMNRLIRRAGMEPWPKPFQALRSSKETELSHLHPMHVVTAWMGNTPKVALKHYLQVTDADFQKAVQYGAETGAGPVHNPVPSLHASTRAKSQEIKQALGTQGLTRTFADWHDNVPFVQVAGAGFEPATSRL